jgi:curved DNA-binding protein CbpA
MNCYFVLGVPSNADAEAIRSAFRILARRYHPDAGSGSSPEKFRQIVEAYETLSDPVRRQAHDDALLFAQPRMMVEVEPMVGGRSYTASPHMFVYGSRALFTSNLDQLFDEMGRSFQEDFLFSPFARAIR